jgi:hypothetical protein
MKSSKASLTKPKLWDGKRTMSAIEKGVPLPQDPRGRRQIWPFADMEIGDSFFLAGESAKCQRALRNASSRYQRKTGAVFATRSVEGGARVWRVADREAA